MRVSAWRSINAKSNLPTEDEGRSLRIFHLTACNRRRPDPYTMRRMKEGERPEGRSFRVAPTPAASFMENIVRKIMWFVRTGIAAGGLLAISAPAFAQMGAQTAGGCNTKQTTPGAQAKSGKLGGRNTASGARPVARTPQSAATTGTSNTTSATSNAQSTPTTGANSDATSTDTTMFDRLAQELGLTAEQQQAVHAILDYSHEQIRARVRQATSDFQTLLNSAETQSAANPSGWTNELDAQVRAQVKASDEQARTDVEAIRTDAEDQIRALLSPEQIATLDELLTPPEASEAGAAEGAETTEGNLPAGHQHQALMAILRAARKTASGEGAVQNFVQSLNLTPQQKAAVQAIHKELRAVRQARSSGSPAESQQNTGN